MIRIQCDHCKEFIQVVAGILCAHDGRDGKPCCGSWRTIGELPVVAYAKNKTEAECVNQ